VNTKARDLAMVYGLGAHQRPSDINAKSVLVAEALITLLDHVIRH
jgi:hypothetical protein